MVAGALAVGQGEEHQRVEIGAVADDAGELGNGRGVVQIALLCGKGKLVVGVDQHDEHAATLGRKLQASRDFLGKHGAGILVIALIGGFARIMEKKGQIKDGWVFELLEQGAVTTEFLALGEQDPIELFDTDQSVLVGCVTMVELVLNEAGEGTEFRDVSSKKSKIVHLAQDSSHLPFA